MQRLWRGTVPLKQPGLNGRPNWRFARVSRRIDWIEKCRREERKEEVGDWGLGHEKYGGGRLLHCAVAQRA